MRKLSKDFVLQVRRQLTADPELAALVEREDLNAKVATLIHDAREAAGFSQGELAQRVGTQQSVISRLEDADYAGHSLSMLKRIADALGVQFRVEFHQPEPIRRSLTPAAKRTAGRRKTG